MGNMRTLAFQVPEELFQKIKDYLQRNNMLQKEFVIGLIENEIERDLAQRATMSDDTEAAAVSGDSAEVSEEQEYDEDQTDSDFENGSDDESEQDEDIDEDADESETEGLSMRM